jgi:hypothetical protein
MNGDSKGRYSREFQGHSLSVCRIKKLWMIEKPLTGVNPPDYPIIRLLLHRNAPFVFRDILLWCRPDHFGQLGKYLIFLLPKLPQLFGTFH